VTGEDSRARRYRRLALPLLVVVAVAGAVLSWDSLYRLALPVFGPILAAGFPLLTDVLILGALLMYIAGASVGRPHGGWRLVAHVAVAGTVALNAMSAGSWAEVPVHVVAPAVWSVLVELSAREVLGDYRARAPRSEGIPLSLWMTAPVESLRTWLWDARLSAHAAARLDTGRHVAMVEAARLLTGKRMSRRRLRRLVRAQAKTGALEPSALLDMIGGRQLPVPGPDGRYASKDIPVVLLAAQLSGGAAATPSGRPGTAPARPASGRSRRSGVVSKKSLAEGALAETGGDVPAAVNLLKSRGTPVGRTTVFEAAAPYRSRTRPVQSGSDRAQGAPGTGPVPDSVRTVGPPEQYSQDPTPGSDTGSDTVPGPSPDRPDDAGTGPDGPDSVSPGPDVDGLDSPDSTESGPVQSGSDRAQGAPGAGSVPDSVRTVGPPEQYFRDPTPGSDTGSDTVTEPDPVRLAAVR
jgi:hypothetical protein